MRETAKTMLALTLHFSFKLSGKWGNHYLMDSQEMERMEEGAALVIDPRGQRHVQQKQFRRTCFSCMTWKWYYFISSFGSGKKGTENNKKVCNKKTLRALAFRLYDGFVDLIGGKKARMEWISSVAIVPRISLTEFIRLWMKPRGWLTSWAVQAALLSRVETGVKKGRNNTLLRRRGVNFPPPRFAYSVLRTVWVYTLIRRDMIHLKWGFYQFENICLFWWGEIDF